MAGSDDKSLSELFDTYYKDYDTIIEETESFSDPPVQEKISRTIGNLEKLTTMVNSMDFFSDNESFSEINPKQLKFLLIPKMLGILWQRKTNEDRKQICEVSETYFQNFLQHCSDYELVSKPPIKSDSENEQPTMTTRVPKPDDIRAEKIRRHKENKELREKIALLSSKKNEGRFDDEDERTLYTCLIKRGILQVEDELQSIQLEKQLISHRENIKAGKSTPIKEENKPKSSIGTFILTKTEAQKKVFGLGYPSRPVLTVEEYYQNRMKDGTWSHHSGSDQGPPPMTEEEEAAATEALIEQDDEEMLARQRNMDEFKDEHRRGWGNRFNRS